MPSPRLRRGRSIRFRKLVETGRVAPDARLITAGPNEFTLAYSALGRDLPELFSFLIGRGADPFHRVSGLSYLFWASRNGVSPAIADELIRAGP